MAALNHTGIVTLYSRENAAGIHFLTMEYVKGKPLADLISGTPLPVRARARYLDLATADKSNRQTCYVVAYGD